MKNSRGLTLVELLAVIAIMGIISVLVASLLINGFQASTRNTDNQRIQQEANLIIEKIRKEYLILDSSTIKLEIDNNNRQLKMDGTNISSGYLYCATPICPSSQELIIRRDDDFDFILELKKDSVTYKIETTLSKLQ